jgi:hypothetical protein
VKTVQNKLARLREHNLIHTDGNIWTLDAGVCNDAEWMLELAERAREATSRSAANQALNNCWELFSRVTGPAYAGGAEASPWAWVDERDDQLGGPTPSERATTTLLDAVRVAVETWDTLATSGLDDLKQPTVLVQILLRLQRALGLAEPWPLFQAAVTVAERSGSSSVRQQIATRLAQVVHDADLDPPETLVAQVVGS